MSVRRKRLDRDDGQPDGAEPIRRDYRASQRKSAATLEYRLARLDGAPVVVKKPTRLSHDFRRTAARRLIRAGVPEVTAMTLLGHATNSIFKRYTIVGERMKREAAEKLAAYRDTQSARVRQVGARSGQVVALTR